ncbi:hypothetical protein Pelo_16932 [Pelomyxa schiedti]|nr:hypothetical protein Pelo_16932 [Pelomyxa schiedti]
MQCLRGAPVPKELVKKLEWYFMEDNMLKHWQPNRKKEESKAAIVVPMSRRYAIFTQFHNSDLGGHMSAERTLARILQTFWWDGIVGDIHKQIRCCPYCQVMNPLNQPKLHTASGHVYAPYPFHTVQWGHAGPFGKKATASGNKLVLNIVDIHTNYWLCIPVGDDSSATTAETLWSEVYTRYGIPQVTAQDNEYSAQCVSAISPTDNQQSQAAQHSDEKSVKEGRKSQCKLGFTDSWKHEKRNQKPYMFHEGDRVKIYKPIKSPTSGKLDIMTPGPYTLLKKIGEHTWLTTAEDRDSGEPRVEHEDSLIAWHDSDKAPLIPKAIGPEAYLEGCYTL